MYHSHNVTGSPSPRTPVLPPRPLPEAPSLPGPFRRPLLVAHRGYAARAPENSLAAVRLAVAYGADMVEVDVHLTRDGVPVVLHDATLDRTTTGRGPVREWTFRELREQVEIRGAPGGPVPTLSEVLALTRGRVPLAVEVKPGDAAEEVLRAIAEAGARRHVAVWSFRRSVVRAVQDLAPDIPCALLYGGARHGGRWTPGEFLHYARRLGVTAVPFFPEDLEPGVVAAARREGLQVYTGTVNDGRGCIRALIHGVDGIVTDQLAGMRALLAR